MCPVGWSHAFLAVLWEDTIRPALVPVLGFIGIAAFTVFLWYITIKTLIGA